MVKTYEKDGMIYTITDFSYPFIKKARNLNGKWTGSEWAFKLENKEFVLEALRDVFGEDGSEDVERVDVLIDLEKYVEERYTRSISDDIEIFNVSVIRRPGRDSRVKMLDYCILTKGEFDNSGGSRVNPRIGNIEGIELKLSNIPRLIVEKEIEKYNLNSITILEKVNTNPIQVKTLIKYKKSTNEIISTYPIYKGERVLIELNQLIITNENEIKSYLNDDINDYELSEAPFGLDSTEYFEIVDEIIECD